MARNPENPRIKDVTPAALRKLAQRLENQATEIEGMAVAMEEYRIARLPVDGQLAIDRAFKEFATFTGHWDRSFKREKAARGH